MAGIYEWIRSLVFYLILMTMVMNLLPNKAYEKYLRLFTGMVFILLVFRPLADAGGLEERMAGAFEKITFQNDARLLQKELEEADSQRMSRLLAGYEEAVRLDLTNMADGAVLCCLEVRVEMERDVQGEEFGSLKTVEMTVEAPGAAAAVDAKARNEQRFLANREISKLRKKIGEYYGLEEGRIQIRLEDE